MNPKKLALGLLSIGAAGCVSALAADPLQLQFTNITAALYGSNYTATLNAVAFGGSNNFLAVGNQKKYILGNFVSGQPWFIGGNWATNQISAGASNVILATVASSGNLFVASGDNNLVFSAANIFSPGGLSWATNYNIFANSSYAPGLAFNGTNFVAVGAVPGISSSGTNLPENKNWNVDSFVTPALSFFESFRGITPFGARGFAACGVAGDVRLSSDGINWSNAPIGSTSQPNYLSIADDGNNTLVCVGAATSASGGYGIIQVFTNISTSVTPLVATNLSANNTPFNSVAYTGSGFVAVGNNGQVFTSTNGVTWFQVPPTNIPSVNVPSTASLNLNGVAFGAAGSLMQDVGEIVGANGNVIICAPPPPTNSSLGNKWICVGVTTPVVAGTKVALPANTLQVTNAWGTNLVTVDWYDAPVGGNLITNGTFFITNNMFSFTPPFVTDNTDNYTNHYWAQARDLRTGFVNTNRTEMVLTNFMRPMSAMVTTNVICNGDSTTLTNLLTGNGPWTVYWTDGFSNFTNMVGGSGVYYAAHPYTNTLPLPNAAFNPTNLFANAATNHNYWVWKLSDTFFPADDPTNLNPAGDNFSGDLAGSDLVTVNPRPTSTSVTTNTICNGSPVTLTNILTGLGPWTVYWTDGFTNYTQVVTVPEAGPYTNTLAIPNSAFNPTNVFLNASTNHYYWVTLVTDSNCVSGVGDLAGTNMIAVNPRPTSTSISTNEICNGDPTIITNVLTGFGPWTVYWTDGTSNFTQVVSVPLAGPYTNTLLLPNSAFNPTNTLANAAVSHSYWVTLVTDSNCASDAGDLVGINLVQVDPRPTSSCVTTNEICNGDTTVLTNVLTGLGPWTVYWTDGTTTYTQAVNINLAGPFTNALPLSNTMFSLTNGNPNQAITNYYWVSGVVSSNLVDGHVCTNWASDLTGTNAVIIDPRPTSTSVTTNAICNGSSTTVTNILTGLGPWTVYWTDGANTYRQPVNVNASGPYTNALSLAVTSFTLTNVLLNQAQTNYYWVSAVISSNLMDGHVCTNWASDLTGTNAVVIYPRPTATVTGTTNICNGQSATIQAVLSGTGPAWLVTWSETWPGGSTVLPVLYNTNVATLTVPNSFLPLTNSLANSTTNYTFTVAAVADSSPSSCGSRPSDVQGNAVVTIYPLPTATVVQVTNSYYNLLTFDELPESTTGILITNGYAGLDWTDFYELDGLHYIGSYSNGVVSTNNLIFNGFGTPANVTSAVPFDLVSAYMAAVSPVGLQVTALGYTNGSLAYSNVYTLTNGPVFTLFNYTNVNEVDFSVTNTGFFAIDNLTIKQSGPTEEICNGGMAVLQSVLTGIGPWTVQWTDGTSNYTQVVSANVTGPYTNTLAVPNTAFNPTNVLLNQTTNYVYTITGITSGTNGDMCSGNISGGPAMVTVSPRPTAYVTGSAEITVTNNSSVTNVIQVALTGFAPWNVTWSDGTNQICTNSPAVRYVTNSLNTVSSFGATNYIYEKWTGLGSKLGTGAGTPAGVYLTNSTLTGKLVKAGTANYPAHAGQWEYYSENQKASGDYYNYFTVQTNSTLSSTSLLSATFQYSVTNLTDATGCRAGTNDLGGSAQIALSVLPSAIVTVVSTNICLGDPAVFVATFSGTPPWTNIWSDGTTNVATNSTFTKIVVPGSTGWYTNTITNLVDGTGVASTNITGNAAVYVNPLAAGIPVGQNQTNCAGVLPNPTLSVTVAPGDTADWYDSQTNLVASGTTNYVPDDVTAGTKQYFVTEVNGSGCGGNQTEVDLVLMPCTNPPAIYLSGTNGTITWFGDLTLQGTTNLVPPTVWQDLSNGVFGTNVLSFTNGVPPWTNQYYFFRLNTN